MGEAIAGNSDLNIISLPKSVWSKTSRPARGMLFRFTLGLTFVLLGFALPYLAAKIILLALGVAAFVFTPSVVDSRLDSLLADLRAAPKSAANDLLGKLDERKLVALFAPCAWVSLAKGELHLKLGDGRAASSAFAECARQCGDLKSPLLVGAQGHALTLSGDRKDARALLADLESREELAALDRLNLAIAYVEDPGKLKAALRHAKLASETLGDHPRVAAALALAAAKAGETADATKYVEALGDDDVDADALAPELLKRARKALRQQGDSAPKKARTNKKAGSIETASAEASGAEEAGGATAEASPAAAPKKKNRTRRKEKRERKKDRRERRKNRGPKKSVVVDTGAHPKAEAKPVAAKVTETAAGEKAGAQKVAPEEKAAHTAAADKAAAKEKAAKEKAGAQKVAAEKAADEKVAAQKAAAEKAADDKVAAQKVAAEKAAEAKAEEQRLAEEKAAAQKAAAEKAAEQRLAEEKAAEKRLAEEKAAEEKAAKEAAEAAKPKPPAISFEGPDNKPIFGAPPSTSGPATPKAAASSSKPAPLTPKPVVAKAPKIEVPDIEVPTAPKAAAPKVAAPKVAAPKVAAPPVVAPKPGAPKPPAIDGWDDLFGDD